MDQANNIIVFGKTGSGKTVKVNNLIKDCTRLICFDTNCHDYNDGVIFDDLSQLKKFWRSCYQNEFRLIYRPTMEAADFDEICRLVWLCQDMTLVSEEMDLFCPPYGSQREVKRLLKMGRHRDISFIGVTQRPKQLDRNVTSQCTEAYIFHTDEPGDVQYLSDRYGSEVKELLTKLERYQYIHVNSDGTKEIGRDTL